MLLSDRLREIRLAFEAGSTSPGDIRTLDAHVESLRAAGQEARAVRPGARAPGFRMASTCGGSVALDEVVSNGPVVLVWFRGSW